MGKVLLDPQPSLLILRRPEPVFVRMIQRYYAAVRLLVLLIAATIVFLSASWGYAREFFAVDSCLDGSGSFAYSAMVCDHTRNHPYILFGADFLLRVLQLVLL